MKVRGTGQALGVSPEETFLHGGVRARGPRRASSGPLGGPGGRSYFRPRVAQAAAYLSVQISSTV